VNRRSEASLQQARFRDLPISIRVVFVMYVVGFVVLSVTIAVSKQHPPRVVPVLLGAIIFLFGLMLAANFKRSAEAYGRWLVFFSWRWWRADYSRSLFGQTWFVRLFGIAGMLVGGLFTGAAFAGALS